MADKSGFQPLTNWDDPLSSGLPKQKVFCPVNLQLALSVVDMSMMFHFCHYDICIWDPCMIYSPTITIKLFLFRLAKWSNHPLLHAKKNTPQGVIRGTTLPYSADWKSIDMLQPPTNPVGQWQYPDAPPAPTYPSHLPIPGTKTTTTRTQDPRIRGIFTHVKYMFFFSKNQPPSCIRVPYHGSCMGPLSSYMGMESIESVTWKHSSPTYSNENGMRINLINKNSRSANNFFQIQGKFKNLLP